MDQVVIKSGFIKSVLNAAIKKIIKKKLKGGETLHIDVGDLEITNDNNMIKGALSIEFALSNKDLMTILSNNHIL